ncbi:hypothetical protein ACIPWF_04170 [Paenarthrobacter sp. NPDC089989]|uniref:hypothetical protein n=1 Tax=unclassified Paenarthrobacter TaxID=2634190 RepID=UPI0037FB7AC7
MKSQGTLFKISAITAIAGVVLPAILLLAFGRVTGSAGTTLTVLVVVLLILSAITTCVALAVYKEQGRRPGSTPLIYAVIAFPSAFVLMFAFLVSQFAGIAMIALVAGATSIPALVIGLVKKLSVKTAPVIYETTHLPEALK